MNKQRKDIRDKMNKPENGLYMAHVTDESVRMMHADEDAVCDAQTDKLFKNRDKDREDQQKGVAEAQERASKAAVKKKRRLQYLVKDVLGLCGTAVLVTLTYNFGLYVAIAAVTGCIVAAVCQVMNFVDRGGN